MTKRESIGFTEGILLGITKQAKEEGKQNQLDFEKAKEIITSKRDKIESVMAGLMEDWNCTCGVVFEDDKFVSDDDWSMHLASRWATPMLLIEYKDGSNEELECSVQVNSGTEKTSLPENWTK